MGQILVWFAFVAIALVVRWTFSRLKKRRARYIHRWHSREMARLLQKS